MARREGTPEQFLVHPRRAVGWGSALLALIALLAFLVPDDPLRLDGFWSDLMQDVETPFLTHVALVFDALGRGVWRALVLVGIGSVLLASRRWAALIAFSFVEALTPLIGNMIKVLVDRPRPPGELVDTHGSSFPSGHTSYASATTVALVLLFTRPGRMRMRWFAVAALVTAAMAWSRTYLQVHWLSDVLVGATLGVAVALLCFGAVEGALRER